MKNRTWTIRLFGEEVVRGRPAFILSILIGRLMPLLRKNAALGNWQVISRAEASGIVRVVSRLASFQEEKPEHPAILIAADVSGNEEIPSSVAGIITSDSIDIVSHLAIRARNAHLLFATCFDPDEVDRLRGMSGRQVKMSVTPRGEVTVEEGLRAHEDTSKTSGRMSIPPSRPGFTGYALRHTDFDPEHLGGKSNNLNRLRGNLPGWIRFPASAAIPFGVFEKVLEMENNRDVAGRYRELTQSVSRLKGERRAGRLHLIRESVMQLDAPGELISSLRDVMKSEDLAWPQPWERAWECIKQVWASKWNERAWLNRHANRIKDDDLFMAVLIQEVVSADYSFVIHTANPFTGKRDELYAEVVVGLGEALVGNYPGRALSFSSAKGGREFRLLSFPSKSVGFFGEGLIFRSDSNGEDLAGYAGAGLYDSLMLPPERKVILDYSSERLIWDEEHREERLTSIMRIGEEVERVMGIPQDIEGVLSDNSWYVVQTRPQVGLEDAGHP